MSDLQRDIDIIDGLFQPHPTKIQNPATVAAWQRIRARIAELEADAERLRLALAEEIAGRLYRALSPNNYQPPPVPPDKL